MRMALGHMGPHMTKKGRAPGNLGAAPKNFIKWVFCYKIWFFLINYAYFKQIFSIFGGYWAFLEARFLEEVGDEKPTPRLYKPGLFEAMDSHSEQSYAEEKPSQSQFDAGKPLRWRRCRIVSGSLEHRFACRFLCRVLEIWENKTRSVL
jgi:hypothetical protein